MMDQTSRFPNENAADSPPTRKSERSTSPDLIEGLLRFDPQPRLIGEVLVELGLAKSEDVALALDAQKSDPHLLGEILIASGKCSEAQISKALEAQAVLASPLWRSLGLFRWNDDLGVTRVNETHRQAVVLSMAERHVQLSVAEFALAESLVSETSFGAIARRFWEETEQLVWPEQLLTLTTRLWALGMIRMESKTAVPDAEAHLASNPAPPTPSGWARWVQVRIPFHDPSKLLDRTFPLGRLLFSSTGLILVLLLVTLAAGVLSVQGNSLWTLVVGNVTHRWAGGVGSFIAAMLLSSIIHEYGHAMACRAFGGQVRRMGIMLYVLAPMAFCDVSDAHRFASKRDRMIVGAAGIYVQLAVASLFAIAWAWLPMPSAVALVLAQFVAVTMVSTLANLNPLLKLDGYYILTDWLEIPNLRSRAFASLDERMASMLGKEVGVSEARTPREHRAFLWYSAFGGAYTVGIAGYMTWMLTHLLLRAFALD